MKYHNITKDDMLNGDGLRVVLWVSGCTLKCKGCQNPLTWSFNDGLEFDESAKQEIFDELDKDYISGITISGGHPLEEKNYETIKALCKEIKEKYPNKTIWIYSGWEWNMIYMNMDKILPYIDVLVDGPFQIDEKDTKLMWKGSSNQRVINVQETLKQENPLIPVLHCPDFMN